MRVLIFIFNILLISSLSFGQKYRMGDIFNPAEVENAPRQADLLTRDYSVSPSAYSLKKWCPIPKDQGNYGTCTSWSTAY